MASLALLAGKTIFAQPRLVGAGVGSLRHALAFSVRGHNSGPTSVNPDLVSARAQASFDPEELTYFLYDGREKTERKRYLQREARKGLQEVGYRRLNDLSREEEYDEMLKRSCYSYRREAELGVKDLMETFYFREALFYTPSHPLFVHEGMFTPTIERQGTEAQKAKWLPRARRMEVVGTYAQTELGHGTNLRALETTAVYDPSTKEFVINTPTQTACKWWPGGLGKSSNHCIVMAMLETNGKNEGMQPFIVQLRDIETHEPMPGVHLQDVGPKLGFWGLDSGCLRLDNVRVPRDHMLMRYSQVQEDGTFIQAQNSRLLLGTMVLMRASLVSTVSRCLAKAVTIATRYSAVRKQGYIHAKQGEVPVMEFQTQQHKVFSQLAATYALLATGKKVFDDYNAVHADVEAGDFSQLPQLHAISAGMKAFSTWDVMHGIEQCRMACGGHGYLLASGLPRIYCEMTPAATYEGENTVMLLQTARFLMKCQQSLAEGQRLPPLVSYMEKQDVQKSQLGEDLNLDHLIKAYEHRATQLSHEAASRLNQQLGKGLGEAEATNTSSQLLVDASMGFCHAYVVRSFAEWVEGSNLGPAAKTALTQLCQLYALQGVLKHSGDFMKGGYLSDDQLTTLRHCSLDLLAAVKDNCQALVDAFDFPDDVLESDLGRYDGNVYTALLDSASQSRLNDNEVHPGFHKYQKPLMAALREIYKD